MRSFEQGGVPESEAEEIKEVKETGKDVRILLKIMRHGERTPDNLLTDFGRSVTTEKAQKERSRLGPLDIVKAVGSDSGPKGPTNMARSLETADLYANAIALDPSVDAIKYQTRPRSIVGIEGQINKLPFDWTEFYKQNLPSNFNALSDEEKSIAGHKANEACLNRWLSDPEAEASRLEIASRYASFVETYVRMIERLKSGTKVMYPVGGHGGNMEVFLSKVLQRKKDGTVINGFQDVSEIGGAFHPSEGFFIDLTTDEQGEKHAQLSMDDPERMKGEDISLDVHTLHQLSEYYHELKRRR